MTAIRIDLDRVKDVGEDQETEYAANERQGSEQGKNDDAASYTPSWRQPPPRILVVQVESPS
jgi:hypothetical protein